MIPHAPESPTFLYDLDTERQALLATKLHRSVPQKAANKLLAATWNFTNFGVQNRTDDDLALMAEIVSWFDLVAVQEIADNITQLRDLMAHLPDSYHVVLTDIGGNYERAGFLYDSSKVTRLELAGEVAVPPKDHRYIRMKGVSRSFRGFDRNPYLAAFQAGSLTFTAVSAHLYFGSHSYFDEDRRALEAYALARWADQRHKKEQLVGSGAGVGPLQFKGLIRTPGMSTVRHLDSGPRSEFSCNGRHRVVLINVRSGSRPSNESLEGNRVDTKIFLRQNAPQIADLAQVKRKMCTQVQ